MINKFKDFLKNKLSRAKSSEGSDIEQNDEELLNEDFQDDEENAAYQTNESTGDSTGNFNLAAMKVKPTLKDRWLSFKNKFPRKFKEVELPSKMISEEKAKPRVKMSQKSTALKFGKFDILALNEKLLGRQSREGIQQVFIVGFIFTVTFTLGKLTALGLKGTPNLNTTKVATETIDLSKDFQIYSLAGVRTQNVFRTNTGLGAKKPQLADIKCEKAEQRSNLPITLVNTIVLQDSVKSLASVQVRSGRELKEVREGEQIDNIAKIFKISRLELIVKNLETGACEYIQNEKMKQIRSSSISVMSPSASKNFVAQQKKMKGIENEGNKFVISKALLDEKLKDIASILTQARAVKIQNPDGTMAFKMTEMDPEGIFSYLGIQDQDVITSINGKPIADLNEIMGLFGRIKNLDNLQLGIRREGSDSNLEYSIKK